MLCCLCDWVEHLVFAGFIIAVINICMTYGPSGLPRIFVQLVRQLPFIDRFLHNVLRSEVQKFTKTVKDQGPGKPNKISIPEKGVGKEELLAELEKLKAADVNPEEGKMFAYVYTSESETFELQRHAFKLFSERTGLDLEHEKMVRLFHEAFMHENALNPIVFPTLRKFENEVISMTAGMLNGDENVVGTLTSGGTESILMALKAYRDYARHKFPHITEPNMVAPVTIHPAHEKAAHYFGFTIRHVPVDKNFNVDLQLFEQSINSNTIGLLCSAPNYCYGNVDPVESIGLLGERCGLPVHVDACFGGFILPWVEKLGYKVPMFDFRARGVTSISADLHKYGFSTKGASVILYRSEEYRKYQYFAYSCWPGGLFGSPSMAGTRPGGNIAAAWVTLRSMGVDGYMKTAKLLMDTTNKIKDGIKNIQGIKVLGEPHMTAFSIVSDDPKVNMLQVADVLETLGWKPERQQYPDALHCSIMPMHARVADQLLSNLQAAVQQVKSQGGTMEGGSAGVYGMMAKIPDRGIIDDFIIEFFSEVYKL